MWDSYNLNSPKHGTFIEENQFVLKTSKTIQRVYSINNMGPRIISISKVIDNDHSRLTMHTV